MKTRLIHDRAQVGTMSVMGVTGRRCGAFQTIPRWIQHSLSDYN